MRILATFLCMFLLLAALSYSASPQKIDPAIYESQDDKVTVIVKANNNYNIEGAENVKQFDQTNFYTARIRKSMLNALEDNPAVEKVWVNGEKRPLLDVSGPLVNVSVAWNIGYNGSGIKICVLDTGVDKLHPALIGRVINESDFTGGNNPDDVYSHGTHVAGIVAGNDATYRGMAFGARILNAKVCDNSGLCFDTDIIAGVDWCVENGANILTLSLGGGVSPADGNDALSAYLDTIVDMGKVVTVAAGNSGPGGNSNCRKVNSTGSSNSICSPGLAHKVITVGSSDTSKGGTSDSLSSFSSRGPTDDGRIKPDLLEPGNFITSANAKWETSSLFVSAAGTSMSTPHAAGIAALMLQARNLTPAEVKAIMMNSALDLNGNFSKTSDKGAGRIDVSRIFGEINNTISGTILNISKIHSIFVPANSSEIRVTLYWSENYSVHQNLDLRLLDPSGAVVKSSTSVLQTEEMIKITNPVSGYWKISVIPAVNGSANYSIASNFLPSGEMFFTNNTLGGISYHRINTTNNSLLGMSIDWTDNTSIQLNLYNTTGNSVLSVTGINHVNISVNVSGGTWTAKLVPSNLSWNTSYTMTSNFPVSDKFVDNISPTINLTAPVNNSFLNKNNITVNFTAIDNLNLEQECSRNLNDTIASLGNVTFGVQNPYILNLSDGTYPLNVTCSDQSKNNATSQTIIFTVDTVKPTISIVSADANNSFVNRNYTFINVSASDLTNISACVLEWNSTNQIMTMTGTNPVSCFVNKTATDGTYTYNILANDSAGNVASLNRIITFDTITPVIDNITFTGSNDNIFSPNGDSIFDRINFNITVSEIVNFSTTYIIASNGSRVKRFNAENYTKSILKTWNGSCTSDLCTGMVPDGEYKIEIQITDRAGNKNSTNLTQTIKLDTTPSQISFVPLTPNNEILTTSNSIIVNVTVTETVSILLEWNGTNETMNSTASSWFKTKPNLEDGNYTFKVYVNDSAGNKNVSETRWVFVNVGRNITSAINNISQELFGSNITVSLLNSTGQPTDSNKTFSFENYTLRFNASYILLETADFKVDKMNSSAAINITKTLVAEQNISKVFNGSGGILDNYVWIDLSTLLPEGNYTARITFPKVYSVYYYLNGSKDTPNFTRITNICNTDLSNKPCYNITTNASVLYLPSFSGAAAGNDTQAPSLSITSPVTSTTYSSSSIPLTYTVSDNVAVDKCLYKLNSDSNITLNGCKNTTITASQGSNTLVLYANDTSENEIKNTITFTFTPPSSPLPSSPPSGDGGGGGSSSSTTTSSTATTSTTSFAPSSPKTQEGNSSPVNLPEEIQNNVTDGAENQTAQNITEQQILPVTGFVAAEQLPIIAGGIIIVAAALAIFYFIRKNKNQKAKKMNSSEINKKRSLRTKRKSRKKKR